MLGPGFGGGAGHGVDLVQAQDQGLAESPGDVRVERGREVEHGVSGVDDEDGDVSALEDAPHLAPHHDVLLERGAHPAPASMMRRFTLAIHRAKALRSRECRRPDLSS